MNRVGDNFFPKVSILDNGHSLDHHVLGYFAPLEFKRIGFGGKLRTPSEQITILSNKLAKNNIRFIYVPLPCKKALYPEYIICDSKLDEKYKVIPQWRKMIKELLGNGIEVIDVYDDMLNLKLEGDLYSKGHYISLFGSEVIGKLIANYLNKTSFIDRTLESKLDLVEEHYKLPVQIDDGEDIYYNFEMNKGRKVIIDEDIYLHSKVDSTIQVIGNCNIGNYKNTGAGIIPHMAYNLGTEVSYLGRYLPFSNNSKEQVNLIKKEDIKDTEVIIYIGFPSASFVRAYGQAEMWNTKFI